MLHEQESYMISYITNRGWHLCDNRWEKVGCQRQLTFNEIECNAYYKRHNMSKVYLGLDFLLNDAFDHEMSFGSNETPITVSSITYNTGDQIFYTKIHHKMIVLFIKTHDNITWTIGNTHLSFGH